MNIIRMYKNYDNLGKNENLKYINNYSNNKNCCIFKRLLNKLINSKVNGLFILI